MHLTKNNRDGVNLMAVLSLIAVAVFIAMIPLTARAEGLTFGPPEAVPAPIEWSDSTRALEESAGDLTTIALDDARAICVFVDRIADSNARERGREHCSRIDAHVEALQQSHLAIVASVGAYEWERLSSNGEGPALPDFAAAVIGNIRVFLSRHATLSAAHTALLGEVVGPMSRVERLTLAHYPNAPQRKIEALQELRLARWTLAVIADRVPEETPEPAQAAPQEPRRPAKPVRCPPGARCQWS